MGVWFSTELQIKDPGVFLIPPVITGIAAPFGVYALDHPKMHRGVPAAAASGALIGAGEGIGIVGYQYVTASKANAWGFRELTRATAIGATLGGVGGYAVGYYMEPPPTSSVLILSGAAWGTAIGAMYGYGASPAGVGYGRSNDYAALGGLIGFNAGAIAAGGLSALFVPSEEQIGTMWAGAGIGAAVSLPVFLFYSGKSAPPAKRGFLFMATATLVGVAAGALIGSGETKDVQFGSMTESTPARPAWAHLSYVAPLGVREGFGLSVGGELL
jgi:hypothetical protein